MKILLLVLALLGAALAEMTADQKHRCEQYTSIFENDTTDLQYAYVEDIHDGRGYTSGRAGFTTGTGDAVEVVKKYTALKKTNPLAKFVPELEKLAKAESGSVANLAGYAAAWKEAAADPDFRKVQDDVSDEMYYKPAMKEATAAGVKTALGMCAFYDTIIQHGGGDDPDSLSAIVKATKTAMGGKGVTGTDEHDWVTHFLAARRHDLTNPHNAETQKEWAGSVDRVDAMTALIKANNWDMTPPMHIKTVNHDLTIK